MTPPADIDLKPIVEAIGRHKGQFAIGFTPGPLAAQKPYSLAAGAKKAVKVGGGYIIALGLDRERLVELRDACNALLGD